jgi:hypothetical protein
MRSFQLPRFVTHNYHDHSDDVDAEKLQTEGSHIRGVSYSTQDGSNGGRHKNPNSNENKQRVGVNMPFPARDAALYRVGN